MLASPLPPRHAINLRLGSPENRSCKGLDATDCLLHPFTICWLIKFERILYLQVSNQYCLISWHRLDQRVGHGAPPEAKKSSTRTGHGRCGRRDGATRDGDGVKASVKPCDRGRWGTTGGSQSKRHRPKTICCQVVACLLEVGFETLRLESLWVRRL